ncbi:MAG TPA: response regulator [Candidatus Methylacidiphilales bacterium]
MLLLIGAVSYHNLTQLNEDSRWVEHTIQVLAKTESLASRVSEVESVQRGYLLTKQSLFLDRFHELPALIDGDIKEIRRLTGDNPVQQSRIDTVEKTLDDRIAMLNRNIETFQSRGGKMSSEEMTPLFVKGQENMTAFRSLLDKMQETEQSLLDERRVVADNASKTTSLTITLGTLLAFLLVALGSWFIVRGITGPLRNLMGSAEKLGSGDYSRRAEVASQDEIGQLAVVFNTMAFQVEQRQDQMEKQEWLKGSIARFNALFQGQRDLQNVCKLLVSELAAVLGIRRSAFYLVETNKGQTTLHWQAGYAGSLDRRTVRPGEGLVGQCYSEKKPLFVDDIPPDYARITSSLGDAAPRALAILPVLFEGRVTGVLEIASFQEFTEIQKSFLAQLLSGLGLVLNAIEAGMRTEELLQQSEVLSASLQAQQEELRQTNEEIQQTNEELAQANSELEERAKRLDEQRVEMEEKNREIRMAQSALEEKAAQLAQTSKYKSEFLATMSHELRTPLNSLLILSNILAENSDKNLTEKQIQYAETIRGAGNDLLQLINDILDLAKIESGTAGVELGELVYADFIRSLERAFRPMAENRGLAFSIEVDPKLPETLPTDVRRVHQVLKNLLSNAVKFTDKGSVRLSIRPEANGDIAFAVKDTGIGISEEKQQIIFEAFQQADSGTSRKYGGTGLGLSISREIARLLGGSLRVVSSQGMGSEFILSLPSVFKPAPEALRATEPDAAPLPHLPHHHRPEPEPLAVAFRDDPANGNGNGNANGNGALEPESGGIPDDRSSIGAEDVVLLVVEDDSNFARLMVDFARNRGFKVVTTRQARNVPFLAERFKPAAITLDLGLPDREGWVVLDQLKHAAATRHIPVHIMSVREERERGLKLGAVSYLKKPVTKEQINDMLGQIQDFAARSVKNLLIIEDDAAQRQSLVELIGNGDVKTTAVGTGGEAVAALEQKHYDCLIMDLGLPDISGFDLIRKIKDRPGGAVLPIIIYTGRDLTQEEERELQKFSEAIIIKNVKSPERLLDETALFLHRLQSKLPEPKRKAIELARQEDSVLAGQTVLVVDDDPRNIFAITAALEQYRMEVLYANTGKEGIATLEQHPEIRAVLMDIMMPEMDGYEAMRHIRAIPKYHSLPILAITAKAMKGDREKCLEAGASDYVTKPVEMEQLRSLLRVWLYR